MFIYQHHIIPKWVIKGYPIYIIGEDKILYNIQSGKKLQMQLKGYTKGYYLTGKFYSLQQLRLLIQKYILQKSPF